MARSEYSFYGIENGRICIEREGWSSIIKLDASCMPLVHGSNDFELSCDGDTVRVDMGANGTYTFEATAGGSQMKLVDW